MTLYSDLSSHTDTSRRHFLQAHQKISPLPELPKELWSEILSKTDLCTCLAFRDLIAAEPYLKRRQDRLIAAQHFTLVADSWALKAVMRRMSIYDRPPVEVLASAAGQAELLQEMLQQLRFPDIPEALYVAGRCGQRECVLAILPSLKDGRYACEALQAAACMSDLELIEEILDKISQISDKHREWLPATTMAASRGDLAILRLLLQRVQLQGSTCDRSSGIVDQDPRTAVEWSILAAAKAGKLQCLEFLYSQFPEMFSGWTVFAAAQGCQLHILEYLHGLPQTFAWPDLQFACEEWHKNNPARQNAFEVVQFLWQHYPDALEAKRSTCGAYGACSRAHGSAMTYAAFGGSLKMMKFLSSKGMPYTPGSMGAAALAGALDIIEFLHDLHPEFCTSAILRQAATSGQISVAQWFHEQHPDMCRLPAMDIAAQHGQLKMLQFLHDSNIGTCTANAMHSAAINRRLDIVEFLHLHRPEGCHPYTLALAIELRDTVMASFLYHNRAECAELKAILDESVLQPGQSFEEWASKDAYSKSLNPLPFPPHLKGPRGGTYNPFPDFWNKV